ncbi:hypothetical protein FA15DRAFT_664698 [Coprinopsis marcescibilis]|uniref:DUF6593 domain-containing protein n=1 Tax=Coprinopsis marcescibilis TaxID=230819 RepID=A0A5C3LK68_COPMA|nr:hypothetical protein FA15DRAFT_664698 [Coprinopsis marcescibilis]
MAQNNSYILRQFGDDPMKHSYQDPEGNTAFTIGMVVRDPNIILRLSRELSWSQQHPSVMGPDNSYFYLGAENAPGYIVYGNGTLHIPMPFFLRPGKKENTTSRYFRMQNGRDYKWKVYSAHRMECMDGRTTIATWEVTEPSQEHFARLTLQPASLPFITEILTSLTLNRISQAHGW